MKSYGVTLQMKPIWQSLGIALFGFQYFMDVKLSFFESYLVQSSVYRTAYHVTPMGKGMTVIYYLSFWMKSANMPLSTQN